MIWIINSQENKYKRPFQLICEKILILTSNHNSADSKRQDAINTSYKFV